jgi:hypothetical protein
MKTRIHLSTLAMFWLLVGLMTMGASHAYAADAKEYPGSMCEVGGSNATHQL